MAEALKCKVLVVGGGPGGYVAAIRAGQLGLDTVLVEAGRRGGTCLLRGCIPSKALIRAATRFEEIGESLGKDGALGIRVDGRVSFDLAAAVAWKDGIVDRLSGGVDMLLKKAKVRVVEGWAQFRNAKTCTVKTQAGAVEITAEHVILANGSVAAEIPPLPFGGNVISSTEALSLDRLPERLAVIGGGYIGVELGTAFRKMGAEVTFIEAMDRLLPGFDKELSVPVVKWLKKHGVNMHLGAKALGCEDGEDGVRLSFANAKGQGQTIEVDKILVTVGRRANTQGWGLENMAVDLDGPFVKVDERCHTSMRNVWAIGDLVGEPMLAHKASAQGEMVAEIIAGERRAFDPVAIPAVCFTEPEIVSVGLTPQQAREAGTEIVTGKFPLAANGRALTLEAGNDGGFVRVVARKDNHLVLGIQAVGRHVAELSGEYTLALEMGAVLEDIAATIHAHPTLSETLPEASLAALGHAIHA